MTATKRVLVVDDDAPTRSAMRHLLEMEGYDVQEAVNGRDALRAIEKATPHVVLSDLRMPEMSGEELVTALGRDGPPVILMTAHAGMDADRAAELGAIGFFVKPIDLAAVLELIATV